MKKYVKGEPVSNPLTSLRLYGYSKALKFSHLPDPGGLLDQNPIILQEWMEISMAENEEEARKQKEEERKRESESRRTQSRHPRPPRR